MNVVFSTHNTVKTFKKHYEHGNQNFKCGLTEITQLNVFALAVLSFHFTKGKLPETQTLLASFNFPQVSIRAFGVQII